MTTRAHKVSKMFEAKCRPQFVLDRYVRMLTRIGFTRAQAFKHIQDIREGKIK